MKKLLAALLLLISSASFAADISINGTFATNGSTFPIANGSQVKGGSFPVADNTARDAIDASIRLAGMEVYSIGAAKTYRLVGGITNGDWTEVVYTAGTVTSVDLSLPNIFTVSGNPVTSTGTLTATLASQSQNLVWSSPNGSSGAPTFRALAAADIPSLSSTYLPLSGGTMSGAIAFSGTQTGTYTLGGTPTIGASLAVGTTASYGIGNTTHLLTAVSTAKLIGGSSNTSGHTVPNVADDTIALLAASQTLTNKTIDGSNNTITNILPNPSGHSGEYLTNNGSTFSWGAVSAGGTLQDAYDAGTPTVVLTSGGGGILIKDAATPLGAPLFSVKSNDGATTYFSVSAGSPGAVVLTLTDGASASVSASNSGRLRYNDSTHYFEASLNTGAYAKIPTISSADTQTNKTFTSAVLTTPVINGATASTGNFDLSGSSGTFKTSTGAATFGSSANTFSGGVLTLSYDGVSEAVSASGTAKIRYNNTSHGLERSLNGGAWTDIAGSGATGNWSFSGDIATDTTGAIIKGPGSATSGLVVGSTSVYSNGTAMQSWYSGATQQAKMVFGTGGANPQLVSLSHALSFFNDNTDGIQTGNNTMSILIGGSTVAKANTNSQWELVTSHVPHVTTVADADKTVATSDQEISYTSISAARVVTLPAASGGKKQIVVYDMSASADGTKTISVARAGSDTINGGTSNYACVAAANGNCECRSDGTSKWSCWKRVP